MRIASIVYYSSYKDTKETSTRLQAEHFNIGYLAALSAAELWTAGFLLHMFATGTGSPTIRRENVNFYRKCCRSTEVRNSLIALLGIARLAVYAVKSEENADWTTGSLHLPHGLPIPRPSHVCRPLYTPLNCETSCFGLHY